uniref:Uncharacterized protein n=1 Tax=Romanomermis culicivorax TaxID=13658 RepID=A0A915HPP5_ROMCU
MWSANPPQLKPHPKPNRITVPTPIVPRIREQPLNPSPRTEHGAQLKSYNQTKHLITSSNRNINSFKIRIYPNWYDDDR